MRGWRGIAAGALTLIALQVLGSGKGPEQGGKFLVWATGGLRRAMDPAVPAIPRTGKSKKPATKPASGDGSGISGSLPRNPIITT